MKNELTALTGLRFLAAFYVFIFHIHLRFPLSFLPAPFQTIIGMGYSGVTIFFVLSGFILTYSHLRDFAAMQLPAARYYSHFLLKRLARIYPAYLTGLLSCGLVSWMLQDWPSGTVAALDATMLQSYVPQLSMKWYGSGAWSVSTEIFFYILFPFLLPLMLRLRHSILLYLLIAMILLSRFPGIYCLYNKYTIESAFAYTFPPSRVFEFMSGILLGILVLRDKVHFSGYVVLILLGLSTLYLMKFGGRWYGYTVHQAPILPAILTSIGVLSQGVPKGIFSWIGHSAMGYLGKISYSFYIMQIPLLLLLDGLLTAQKLTKTDLILTPFLLLANLGLAALVYKWIENPFHKTIISKLFRSS